MKRQLRLLLLLLMLLQPCLVISKPLKVFILAGQSNMAGQGRSEHFLRILNDPLVPPDQKARYAKYHHSMEHDNHRNITNPEWRPHPNAYIRFDDWNEPLRMGMGARSGWFGPELEFGFLVGDMYGSHPDAAAVLLIKVALGGTSLAVDWRPPSSPPSTHDSTDCVKPDQVGCAGSMYRQLQTVVNDTLASITAYAPHFDEGDGYELVAFLWFQGFNDVVDISKVAEYEENLRNFIQDIRDDLEQPNLHFLIGELGMEGPIARNLKHKYMRSLQRRIATTTPHCTFVPTSPFVRHSEAYGKFYDGQYHYYGRADTFLDIGQSFARPFLPEPTSAPSPRPSVSETPTRQPTVTPAPSVSESPTLTPSGSQNPTNSPSDSAVPTAPPSLSMAPSTSQIPSISPLPSNSQLPSTAPSIHICDDDPSQLFFVPASGEWQNCRWLAARPAWQLHLCPPGQPAHTICRELCHHCADLCYDDPGATFDVGGIARTCAWLALRPHLQEQLCQDARGKCPETCHVTECEAQKIPVQAPSLPLPSSSSPTDDPPPSMEPSTSSIPSSEPSFVPSESNPSNPFSSSSFSPSLSVTPNVPSTSSTPSLEPSFLPSGSNSPSLFPSTTPSV